MAEIRYGYMVVCYDNNNKVIVQAIFTNHAEIEVYEIATKAFVPNYHFVKIYKVGEIDTHG